MNEPSTAPDVEELEDLTSLLVAELGLPFRAEAVDLLWYPTQGVNNVQAIAHDYKIPVKKFRRRLAGYPDCRTLLTFGRVLDAARIYLEAGHPSIEDAAYRSSRWDGASFSNRCFELTGIRPRDWRNAGGTRADLVTRFAAQGNWVVLGG